MFRNTYINLTKVPVSVLNSTRNETVNEIPKWAGIAGVSETTYEQIAGLAFYTCVNTVMVTPPAERLRITGTACRYATTTPTPPRYLLYHQVDIGFSGASGSTYKWTIGGCFNGGRFAIASSTALGTSDMFVINGAGYVGIGTTTPGSICLL